MNENMPNNTEEQIETLPTTKDIGDIFEKLLDGAEGKITNEEYDNDGNLLILEVRVEDKDGGYSEYSYDRQGRPKEGEISPIMIYVTYYDKDGTPYNGGVIGEHVDGEWRFNK